eukprot:gene11834-5848_t
MPSQRQFFSDAVSTKLLFYSPAGDSGAAAADPVGAVEAAGSVAAPDEGEGYSYRIFKVSSFAVDGYGAPSVTPTPTSAAAAAAADSVARYLEEFYPTKPEFKARTKAYVAALRGRDATAAAAAGDFAGMQELTRRVLKDFSNWRFYKALATDSDLARIKATGETVAAKKLKDWKKTAGGSLVRERDWLLLFDDPNILPMPWILQMGYEDLHSDNILIGEDRAVLADLGSAKEVIHGERHTESLIHYKYIKPLEVQDKSSDPSCLGALYGTPFDIYALACMVIGMALGIPCIEIRDHELRSKDLQDAGLKIPTLLPLLRSMLAEKADQRPTAKDVAAKLKEVLAKL